MNARHLTLAAMLAAMAIIIPLAFKGFLQVIIPPFFSATLGAHVPEMIAIFISPGVALFVGLASALGFLLTLGPVVAARALTHAVWGIIGALLYRHRFPRWAVLLLVLPVHALLEGAVVLIAGRPMIPDGTIVAVGTAAHHVLDALITLVLLRSLAAVSPRRDWLA